MNILTFNFFTNVLYGDDVNELAEKCRDYKNPDGSIEELPIREFLLRCMKAYIKQFYNPLTNIFPILNKYNLAGPFKRDFENLKNFKESMKELIANSKDKKSICSLIMENEDFTYQEKFEDLIVFMVGGSETSSHTLVSILFYLKKFPKTLENLKNEIAENGFTKDTDLKTDVTIDKLQNMDYINNVIKEALRMDNPTTETFFYQCYEDIEICGVPIPNGTLIKPDIVTAHYNGDQWLEPLRFEPDRFNPESEFYQEAQKNGKNWNVYSRRSFSHGLRNCPGQSLAYLEIKTILIYFLTRMEYDFSPEILNKEDIGFGIGNEFVPDLTIHKL